MGEVYRARDARLKREVAVKLLPPAYSKDADRLRRFEQEAQAAGGLNHPNITAVYDVGELDGAPYIVTELLEGETLGAALSSGKLPQRKAIDYALQIARGLDAAHEKGIVHRDLKPHNLFILKDGRVKILDFGLAKLMQTESETGASGPEATGMPTATGGTEPGVVLGTLGYMSPEQVKGKPADARSDIFSFGAILYEMLSGNRAFRGDSAAETMSAILREEPPDLSVTNQSISPGVDRIVRHCLEKNPEQRFRSAHDVAFALEGLSGLSTSGLRPVPESFFPAGRRRRLLPALIAVLLAGTAAAAYVVGRRIESASRRGVSFQQLTTKQQTIYSARFAPDGRTIVYSAALQGNTPEIFIVRPDVPEPRALGLRGGHLLSISRRGELALLTKARYISHNVFQGTLAQMPLEGGAPRDIVENVRDADWSPDGSSLAVIREIGGRDRLEFPVGKVLCETGGYFSEPRFAPRGGRIAFFEHPAKWDDRGLVAVVDLQGKKTVLADGFWGEEGLAWSSDGEEVLFSAGKTYSDFRVLAVTLSGRQRTALESAGGLTIRDVRPDGNWLATRDDFLQAMPVFLPGQTAERDLSWLDLSDRPRLSADGKTILFTEQSGSLGANYAVCLRRTDGSPVVRLGEGMPGDLSPDGKWALAIVPKSPQQLVLYPTGAGEARQLDRGEIESYESAVFFPDGHSVLPCGHASGHGSRCWVQEIAGGKPRPITPEGTTLGSPSPDARQVVVRASGGLVLYPVAGGEGRPVPGTTPDDIAIRWSRDGGSLLVYGESSVLLRIERVALPAGTRDLVRTLGPADMSGVTSMGYPFLAGDEKSYAYVLARSISHLFLVERAR